MPKCDFNKVVKQLIEIALQHGRSPEKFAAYFKNISSGTPGRLPLSFQRKSPRKFLIRISKIRLTI